MVSDLHHRQLHAIFAGQVQGVGFRYTVCRIAERFSVTGFIRNLANGDVELLAEGEEQELSEFLREIRNSPLKRHVLQERADWRKAEGAHDRFGVSFQ